MAIMWRCFRESGPPPENIPESCYTMEIFHGGYFDKQLDGTKKYKLARFNKLGGKLYLDGLDPDKISWVEFNNIAWELGYREKPISYHFKVPRTCRRWQLSGMSCVHAICAIRSKHQEPALYYTRRWQLSGMPSMYQESYTPIIHPIAGDEDWEPVDYPIAPPLYKKQAGRPKMKRVKEPGESKHNKEPPAPNIGKMRRTYIKMTCQVCKKQGHNILGCSITKAAKAAAMGEGSSNGGHTSRKRKRRQQAPRGSTNLKDQIIRSRKTWKKIKATMNSTQGVNAKASTSKSVEQPPTQSSQNAAARSAHQCPSQLVQPSQTSSEWAGF